LTARGGRRAAALPREEVDRAMSSGILRLF